QHAHVDFRYARCRSELDVDVQSLRAGVRERGRRRLLEQGTARIQRDQGPGLGAQLAARTLTPVMALSLWEGAPLNWRPSADAVAGGGQKDTLTDASICFEPAFLL